MRREWNAWIKVQAWNEFEALAKKDPSQDLADTVAELERGFESKSDRRALKKVLFLLRQQGFVPNPIEEATEPPQVNAGPSLRCFQLSPEMDGTIRLMIPHLRGSRVTWWYAKIHLVRGLQQASTDEMTLEQAVENERVFLAQDQVFLVCAPVDREYALGRLKHALDTSTRVDPVTAGWRAKLLHTAPIEGPDVSHIPREDYAGKPYDSERDVEDALHVWRLELGTVTSLYGNWVRRVNSGDVSPDGTYPGMDEEIAAAFTPGVLRDQVLRLREAAFLSHLRGVGDPGRYLAVADDLETKGGTSAYAVSLVMRTLFELAQIQERERQAKAASTGAQP